MERKNRNFLFALAGARQEILDQCGTERIKFQSLGLAILITSVLATVSMWFALNSVLGLNAVVALLGALVWGLVIMGIDRWLVATMPTSGRRRWSIALPRVVLAVLLGSLISTPFVLRIFQSEINAQLVLIKQERASAFIALQQHSKVGQQVAFWTKDVNNLQRVIDSNGDVPLNSSTDAIILSLTKQRTAEVALAKTYYNAWQCQLYGGKGCTRKGNGPLAAASHRSYLEATAQVTKLTNEIQQRDKQLSAGDSASRKQRLAQATSALPAAKQHLAIVTGQEDALEQKYAAQNISTNGLLIRLEALNQLAGKSFTINSVRLLLFLLFLVIECLPVTVKLLQQPGIYEQILEAAAAQELREARKTYGARPRTANAAPYVAPNGATATPRATKQMQPTADELRSIWRSRTIVEPVSEQITTDEPRPPMPDVEEPTKYEDQAIRNMQEIAVRADSTRRPGVELRYSDDDL